MYRKTMLKSVACLALALTAAAAMAADYSAVQVVKMGAKTQTHKLYASGDKHRIEANSNVLIARPDKGLMWFINPQNKTYTEKSIPKVKRDSISGLEKMAKTDPGVKRVGTEKVSGYVCDKYTMKKAIPGSKSAMNATVWFSKKLKVDVKSEIRAPQFAQTSELKNIKEEKQSASLFELPKGYKKMQIPNKMMPQGPMPKRGK